MRCCVASASHDRIDARDNILSLTVSGVCMDVIVAHHNIASTPSHGPLLLFRAERGFSSVLLLNRRPAGPLG